MLKWTKTQDSSNMSEVLKTRATAPLAPPPLTRVVVDGPTPTGNAVGNGSTPSLATPRTQEWETTDDLSRGQTAGIIAIDVTLPSGQRTEINVDYNTPMMDLLVSLAGQCRLSPSGLALVPVSEDTGQPLSFTPNQTVGSLGARVVRIVNKEVTQARSNPRESKSDIPFQVTHRFTVNFPRGQKAVIRVSPSMTLNELITAVCLEKGTNPRLYDVQIPGRTGWQLEMNMTVQQLGTYEMNLIPKEGTLPASDNFRPNITSNQLPTSQADPKKKKKGILSFLGVKDQKSVPDTRQHSESGPATTQRTAPALKPVTSPASQNRDQNSSHEKLRPKSMFVASSSSSSQPETSSLVLAAPARKTRHAPAPPVPAQSMKAAARITEPAGITNKGPTVIENKDPAVMTIKEELTVTTNKEKLTAITNKEPTVINKNEQTVSINKNEQTVSINNISTTSVNKVEHNRETSTSSQEATVQTSSASHLSRTDMLSHLHSRNSSDSSGYHELTLSGCDSPEPGHSTSTSHKTSIDATFIMSSDNGTQESVSRVSTILEVQERLDASQPHTVSGHFSVPDSAHSQAEVPVLRKKRKAPPPPPTQLSSPTSAPTKPTTSIQSHPEITHTNNSSAPTLNTKHNSENLTEMIKYNSKNTVPIVTTKLIQPADDLSHSNQVYINNKNKSGQPEKQLNEVQQVSEIKNTEVQLSSEDNKVKVRRTFQDSKTENQQISVETRAEAQQTSEDKVVEIHTFSENKIQTFENSESSRKKKLKTQTAIEEHQLKTDKTSNKNKILNDKTLEENKLLIGKTSEENVFVSSGEMTTPSTTSAMLDFNDILAGIVIEEDPLTLELTFSSQLNPQEREYSMMVETSSILSEDIDQDDTKPSRPCEFTAPPPPSEPPPVEQPPVQVDFLFPSRAFADKETGVNEDNTSLLTTSLLNSPDIGLRRKDSISSLGSQDSLGFQQVIQLGEEAVTSLTSPLSELPASPEYKTEMALFVERMKKLALESAQTSESEVLDDSTSSVSASENNSETGSVIRHLRSDSRDSSFDAGGSLTRWEGQKLRSVHSLNQVEHFVEELPDLQVQNLAASEEIDEPSLTLPPPPGFDDSDEHEDEKTSSRPSCEAKEATIVSRPSHAAKEETVVNRQSYTANGQTIVIKPSYTAKDETIISRASSSAKEDNIVSRHSYKSPSNKQLGPSINVASIEPNSPGVVVEIASQQADVSKDETSNSMRSLPFSGVPSSGSFDATQNYETSRAASNDFAALKNFETRESCRILPLPTVTEQLDRNSSEKRTSIPPSTVREEYILTTQDLSNVSLLPVKPATKKRTIQIQPLVPHFGHQESLAQTQSFYEPVKHGHLIASSRRTEPNHENRLTEHRHTNAGTEPSHRDTRTEHSNEYTRTEPSHENTGAQAIPEDASHQRRNSQPTVGATPEIQNIHSTNHLQPKSDMSSARETVHTSNVPDDSSEFNYDPLLTKLRPRLLMNSALFMNSTSNSTRRSVIGHANKSENHKNVLDPVHPRQQSQVSPPSQENVVNHPNLHINSQNISATTLNSSQKKDVGMSETVKPTNIPGPALSGIFKKHEPTTATSSHTLTGFISKPSEPVTSSTLQGSGSQKVSNSTPLASGSQTVSSAPASLPPPPLPALEQKGSKDQSNRTKTSNSRPKSKFEPQVDPKEQLLSAIRNFSRDKLRSAN